MRFTSPKPLHVLCRPPVMLPRAPARCRTAPSTGAVVVVGHGAERVTKMLQED